MKNKFILLHLFPKGELTLINVSSILSVDVVDKHSFVSFAVTNKLFSNPSCYGVEVKESISEIIQYLGRGDI